VALAKHLPKLQSKLIDQKLHVLFQKVIFKVIKSFYLSSSILKSLSLSPNQVISKVKTEKETKEVYVFYGK